MGADAAAKLGDLLGSAFGGLFDQPAVRLGVGAISAYVAIVWLACAWWAFQDMRRRTNEPAAPYLAAGLVILATPLVFPLALLVYTVLRPGRTIAEARLLGLERQIDELDAELTALCPECGRLVDESWLSCPACRTRLAYACRGCARPVGLDWSLCAWCGTEFGGTRLTAPALPAAFAIPTGVSDAGVVAASQPIDDRPDDRRRRWGDSRDRRPRRVGDPVLAEHAPTAARRRRSAERFAPAER
jgi:RNA polymerase subunit RPABC4/transcription elongation factor Spt4